MCSQSVDEERNQDYSYLGYFRLFLNKNKLSSELPKFKKKIKNKCLTRDVAILKKNEKRLMLTLSLSTKRFIYCPLSVSKTCPFFVNCFRCVSEFVLTGNDGAWFEQKCK